MNSLLGKLARREQLREARGEPSDEAAQAARFALPARVPGTTGETLDFDSTNAPLGVRHTRQELERPLRCFGKVALAEALTADTRLLARLALDPALELLALKDALYLDTETSGLGGGTGNRAFLVGMCWFDSERGAFVLEQLLLRDLDDEAALLDRVRERVEAASFIVSYNGKSFDVPLLRTRMLLARLGPFPERPHLDLLHLARRVHARRGWRMSLGVVEKRVLGFERGPDIAGEEVAMRYAHYLWSGDEGCLAEVVTHNRYDVWSLVALLGYYGRAPESDAAFQSGIAVPELSAMARVLRRAGDLGWATRIADRAVALGPLDEPALLAEPSDDARDALWTRARIAKSSGDRAQAMADFTRLVARAEDADARLELAKLYEHFCGELPLALELVALGTGESPADTERRRQRLIRKIERKRK